MIRITSTIKKTVAARRTFIFSKKLERIFIKGVFSFRNNHFLYTLVNSELLMDLKPVKFSKYSRFLNESNNSDFVFFFFW